MSAAITIQRQIDCVIREIVMRERVYPQWVAKGRMKPEKAAEELAAMRAALETLLLAQARA